MIYKLFLGLLLTSTSLLSDTSTTEQGRTVINLAGKQRMLTQKMSKEALLIIKGIEVKKNRAELQETIAMFDKTLYGLKMGDKELSLPKTEDKEIVRLLTKEIKLWHLFKQFLDRVVEGRAEKNTLKAVEITNMPLLNLMNRIVHLYEKKYNTTLSSNLARTINLAGRERMLIQKMTKELLLIANNIKSDAYIQSLTRNGQLFQTKLDELLKDKAIIKEEKLTQKVKDIQLLWAKYQDIIAHTELSKEGVKIFNEKEKKIVEKMSKEMTYLAKIIDAKRYQITLIETQKLFDSTLNSLIESNSNKEIAQQLQKVKKIWKEYQPTIVNIDTSKEGLANAIKLNMPLLKEMDRVVKLYETL